MLQPVTGTGSGRSMWSSLFSCCYHPLLANEGSGSEKGSAQGTQPGWKESIVGLKAFRAIYEIPAGRTVSKTCGPRGPGHGARMGLEALCSQCCLHHSSMGGSL